MRQWQEDKSAGPIPKWTAPPETTQRGQAFQASDFGTDLMLAECQSFGEADTLIYLTICRRGGKLIHVHGADWPAFLFFNHF
jgi:hypothetical protein